MKIVISTSMTKEWKGPFPSPLTVFLLNTQPNIIWNQWGSSPSPLPPERQTLETFISGLSGQRILTKLI